MFRDLFQESPEVPWKCT